MRIFKAVLWTFGGGLVVLVLGIAGLYLAAAGPADVPATVATDDTLPALNIGGVRLHVRDAGAQNDGLVVVLHGGPGGDFRSLTALDQLADRFHVVFYDQRGAGLSSRVPAADLTLAHYVAELEAVLDHFATDGPVALIGHSWGAMLAAAFLAHDPERIAAAVLIEPGFLNAAEYAQWRARAERIQRTFGYLQSAIWTGFRAQHVTGPDTEAQQDFLFGHMAHAFADAPDNPYHCAGRAYNAPSWRFGATASQAAAAITPDELALFERGARTYPGPVLLLSGSCNDWIGAPLQARHAQWFAEGQHVVIEDAGHDVVWDQPEQTLAAVRQFLSETIRSRPQKRTMLRTGQ